MVEKGVSLEDLWKIYDFRPNEAQERAIRHVDGPLHLPAGPGSGKTRVLLWRTLNLIVFHDVPPEAIFLSTFTEKAAQQLREGLQALLGEVTNCTGRPYDYTQIYVGTVHSLCQRMLTDRRFSAGRKRLRPPYLLDELGQYFHLYRTRTWKELVTAVGLVPGRENGNLDIYRIFNPGYDFESASRYYAITECIGFFNRVSQECIDPRAALCQLQAEETMLRDYCDEYRIDPEGLALLFRLYIQYQESLTEPRYVDYTDFALVQQKAYDMLTRFPGSESVFRHVIVDEYQDTNTIQERLFFKLAAEHKNICVVGDDDQALYRFRGATVENFVEFPDRCQQYLGETPTIISLNINYRSWERIVDFYRVFIQDANWEKDDGDDLFRVPKDIGANRSGPNAAVVASSKGRAEVAFAEIAHLVRELIDTNKVDDPNQVAFLFPSLGSKSVKKMRAALREEGLEIYAPRAGRFLEVEEAIDIFGIFANILGLPSHYAGELKGDYGDFVEWMHLARERGEELISQDPMLALFVGDRREEIAKALSDYEVLQRVIARHRWDPEAVYDIDTMKRPLHEAPGLSGQAKRVIGSPYLDRIIRKRLEKGKPFDLSYIIIRATSMDWNVLDIFYRILGFEHFKTMVQLAKNGHDEGPIFNLALISQYLSRFIEQYSALISAEFLKDGAFKVVFFMTYLFSLFRLGESEYEDAEDPFPKGRIPFITIHQAKGLEFPVVVVPNPRKINRGPQRVELMVHPFLSREEGEPLDRMGEFDIMRLFYVALSRAKNLLVLGAASYYTASRFRDLYKSEAIPRIPDLDVADVTPAYVREEELPRAYSYTSDYLNYRKCPRQYMFFRQYGFAPSRTQMMFFGSLVHRTLEDLHNYLIGKKEAQA